MTPPNVFEQFWMRVVRSLGCVVCRRVLETGLPTEVHHIAKGSGLRSHYALAPLCGSIKDGGHHRGQGGFHGMGERPFCELYGVPGLTEWGLLVWTLEDLAKKLRLALPRLGA